MNIVYCGYGVAGQKCLSKILESSSYSNANIRVYAHESDADFIGFLDDQNITYSTNSINSELALLSEFEPSLIISVYYRHIISEAILSLASGRAFNCHPSLLPDYRGCFSNVWTIINQEKETGITFHYMNKNIDEGNIILQKKHPILPTSTAYSLYHELVSLFEQYFMEALALVLEGYPGEVQRITPEHRFYKRALPFDGVLVAKETSLDAAKNFIRAMYFPPLKGAEFILKDGSRHELTDVSDLQSMAHEFLPLT